MKRSTLFVFVFLMMCAVGIFAATVAKKPMTTKPATAAAAKTPANYGIFSPDSLQWSNAPAVMPAGAMLAVMEGNPSKTGSYTMRLKMPANYKIQPHYHPGVEHVTVITGTLKIGMGDKFDETNMTEMKAGTFGFIAPRMHHYAMATEDTVIQLHGMGPWKLIYLNPADDPSKMHK
jgi:quercetin dioxygenase-like cupin family protein